MLSTVTSGPADDNTRPHDNNTGLRDDNHLPRPGSITTYQDSHLHDNRNMGYRTVPYIPIDLRKFITNLNQIQFFMDQTSLSTYHLCMKAGTASPTALHLTTSFTFLQRIRAPFAIMLCGVGWIRDYHLCLIPSTTTFDVCKSRALRQINTRQLFPCSGLSDV